MKTTDPDDGNIGVEEVHDLTPHNEALYEAGKKMLVESVDVGREFCKFMTTTTLAAIPIYLSLLKLVLPKSYSLESNDELIFLIPPAFFLISSIIFVLGYFPKKGSLSLDLPTEIERERKSTILRRHNYAIAAFFILCGGIVFSSWVLVSKLTS